MKVHVCIVSDQVLANLIPALMDRPDKVWLASSRDMTGRKLDQRLKKLLEHEGITVEIRTDAPDAGMAAIHEFALNLAGEIEKALPDAEVTLNATGGTKLMAMGFVEIFRGIAQAIIYTDTRHRCIERLPDGTRASYPSVPMTNVLDVPRYLAAQGFITRRILSDQQGWQDAANARKAAAKYLGRHAENLGPFIGIINALAGKALQRDPDSRIETLATPRQDFHETPRGEWANALRELGKAGLVGWQEGSREIIFIDAARTQFIRGGWLEEYAWHIVHDEKPCDARLSVTVTMDDANNSENEFDVLATHCNQLLFIECKTLNFNRAENDNELAYKLDSLGKLARGLFGETWLLSARNPTPVLAERAKINRIRLIGPAELPKLREAVQAWMRGPD